MTDREDAIEKMREDLREAADRDQLVMKAVEMLDQLNSDIFKQVERFRDWYAIHFPELEKEIGDDEDFMKIFERGIRRDDLDAFESLAEKSTGSEILEEDEEILETVAKSIRGNIDARDGLERYIQSTMREIAPNVSEVLGPVLGARVISLAGGLEEMAKKPASTIQMLGAEKALFRYMRGEGTPPKHGVIFEHEFVSSLPSDTRGKMARFVANKSVMAARLDQYGDKRKGDELYEECREKYEELQD